MNYIKVKGRSYRRKAHKRTGGIAVNKSYVSPSTYKGRKNIIKITEKGELTKHGYSIHKSAVARRNALKKSISEDGALTTWRRLNAQYVFRRRTDGLGAKFKADRNWVSENYLK